MHSFEDIKIVQSQLFNELGALIHFLLCRHKAPYQIQSMLTIHHFPETNIPEYNINSSVWVWSESGACVVTGDCPEGGSDDPFTRWVAVWAASYIN